MLIFLNREFALRSRCGHDLPTLAGQAKRREGEIGIASLRAGDIVGTHTVLFGGTGERLTIGHEATDRAVFASGAIRAAGWLAAQKPGRYTMAHVLGLKTTG